MNTEYLERNNQIDDYGERPYITNIYSDVLNNDLFRKTVWTGEHLQMTLMSIKPNENIGLEIHKEVDQVLVIFQGEAVVKMGKNTEYLSFQRKVREGNIIFVPAMTWHDVINIGNGPLKLFSIYAPPDHKKGTVHKTKEEAEQEH